MSVYETLSKINVNDKTEKKGRFTYLSWAWAWAEVKRVYPNATFQNHLNENGTNIFYDKALPNMGAFVRVSVSIEEITLTEDFPILNHSNKTIALDNLNAFDINTALKRALVKCLGLHGLGLYIYAGEDLPEGGETNQKNIKKIAKDPYHELIDNMNKEEAKTIDKDSVSLETYKSNGLSVSHGKYDGNFLVSLPYPKTEELKKKKDTFKAETKAKWDNDLKLWVVASGLADRAEKVVLELFPNQA